MREEAHTVVARGGHRFENGTVYVGSWNSKGLFHGKGHLLLPSGTRYDGNFEEGYFCGTGVLTFADGAKYEGEFLDGWFQGHGIFWRADGMRYEGQFRGGHLRGIGLVTFNDGSNGFPRYEGFFQDCRLLRKISCPEIIERAQKIAYISRNFNT